MKTKLKSKIPSILLSLFLAALPFTALNVLAVDDSTPPSAPTNLTAALNASNQVVLNWNAATDNTGVSGYTILRANAVIANATTTSFLDKNIATSTTYLYSVLAYDAAGNVSTSSPQVSITTSATSTDTAAPSAPTNLGAFLNASNQIFLSWTASTDNVGVTGYKITRGNSVIANATTTNYADVNTAASTTYTYSVAAYDAAGNVSTSSAPIIITTAAGTSTDTTVPSTPGNLAATAVSSNQVNLNWASSTDNIGVTGYNVYRNNLWVASTASTSYSNIGLTPSTTYSFYVRAYDAAGNLSATSSQVSVTTLAATSTDDTAIPSTPSNLNANAVSSSQINLSWTASTDNIGVTGYNIYRDSVWVASTASTNYNSTGLTPSTSYNFFVRAYDAKGNLSNQSSSVTATTLASTTTPPTGGIDNTAPSTPANLSIVSTSDNKVTLSWTASTDNVGVAGYSIYRNGEWLKISTTNSFTDKINSSKAYTYYVRAFDESGNVSGQSNHVSTSSSAPNFDNDVVAPSTPSNLTVNSTASDRVNISWMASTDNVAVIGYNIYQNGEWLANIDGMTSFTASHLNPSTSYTYYVRAYDDRGNMSGQSNVVSVTTASNSNNNNNNGNNNDDEEESDDEEEYNNDHEDNIYQHKNNGNNGNHYGQLKNKDKENWNQDRDWDRDRDNGNDGKNWRNR